MSRDGTPRHHLADGLHHRGKEPAAHFFRSRPCMDSRQCWLGVAVCEPVRIEWCRRCLLWLICLSRIADLSDRSHAQRIPMVGGKQEHRLLVPFVDSSCILQFVFNVTTVRRGSRSNRNGSERSVFVAQRGKSAVGESRSATDPTAAGVASTRPLRNLVGANLTLAIAVLDLLLPGPSIDVPERR